MKRLSIIEFVPSLKPTGMVTVALDLARLFRQRGCRVIFWYLDELEGVLDEDSTCVKLNKLPNTVGFDIIHSHGLRPDLALYLNRRQLSIPSISTLHSYYAEDIASSYNKGVAAVIKPFWQFLLKRHVQNVALQSDMAAYYRNSWKLNNITVIPNARSVEQVEQNGLLVEKISRLKTTHKIIVSAGLAISRKGLDTIVPALTLLPGYAWVHFGVGPMLAAIETKAKQLGIVAYFPGYVAHASAYFNLADVFVMPSKIEGMPLALLEAVSHQVPSVVNNLPAFKHVFLDDEVVKCDVANPEAFAEAIKFAHVHGRELVAKASNRLAKEYTEAVVANKYLELMNRVVQKKIGKDSI